jgi:hypothetical protein
LDADAEIRGRERQSATNNGSFCEQTTAMKEKKYERANHLPINTKSEINPSMATTKMSRRKIEI